MLNREICLSFAVAATILGTSNIAQANNSQSIDALAVCWQSNTGKHVCDGPIQRLMSSYENINKALELVGCSDGYPVQNNSLVHRSLGQKFSVVYKCGYKLRPGDTSALTNNRDVRQWWSGIIH